MDNIDSGFCEVCPGTTHQDCLDAGFIARNGTDECSMKCAG